MNILISTLIFLISYLTGVAGQAVLRAGVCSPPVSGPKSLCAPSKGFFAKNPLQDRRTLRQILLKALVTPFLAAAVLIVITGEPAAPLDLGAHGIFIILLASALIQTFCFLFRAMKQKCAGFAGELPAVLVFAFALTLCAEVFVFNYRSLQSAGYSPAELGGDAAFAPLASKPGEAEFLIPDTEIKNIFIGAYLKGEESQPASVVTVRLRFTDEANALYTREYVRTVYPGVEESKYIPVHLSGKSQKLHVALEWEGDNVMISNIILNSPRPFSLRPGRMALIFALACFFSIIRPGGGLSGYMISGRRSELGALPAPSAKTAPKSGIFAAFAVCTLVCAGISAILVAVNGDFGGNPGHHDQLAELARSFSEGRLYLDEQVPDFLKNMENPYDSALRAELAGKAGQSFHWDAAYFDGHYYVYFGVVPVILLYLPYFLLTGRDLPNAAAVLVFALIFAAALAFMVYEFIRRFSRRGVPLPVYILLTLTVFVSSGAVFLCTYPDLYSVPIISALAFTVCGLALWCLADKYKDQGRAKFSACLFAGSLCMALSVGCRPQFALISFAALPLFYESAVKERRLLSKKGLGPTVAFCLPYIAVAASLMWYNAARFGSPFDFGAAYNLTTNDVSRRGFVVDRIAPAAFYYLFQPPVINAVYPFLSSSIVSTSYVGLTISQDIYGGLFFQAPFAALSLASLFCGRKEASCAKNRAEKFLPRAAALVFLAVSMVFVAADATAGGILQRYMCDFAFPFLAGALIMFLSLYDADAHCPGAENAGGIPKSADALISRTRGLHALLLALFAAGALFSLMFALTRIPLDKVYQLLFWL